MRSNLTRRDFHKLTSAALGGMVTGTLVGCSSEKKAPDAGQPKAADAGKDATAVAVAIHACRGLNECKGQGVDGKNSCAGQGSCHTAKAHDCASQNDCKHQGGCGAAPGYNDCKGQGGCGVPMQSGMWEKARARLETDMKAKDMAVGVAPPAAK
jgi:hypothetical protein